MKKLFIIIGTVAVAVILAVGVALSIPARTVDFRGTVDSITYDEAEDCYYLKATSLTGGIATIRVASDVSVKSLGGDEMSASEIKAGDDIDLDYKGKWTDAEIPVLAKWVRVTPRFTSTGTLIFADNVGAFIVCKDTLSERIAVHRIVFTTDVSEELTTGDKIRIRHQRPDDFDGSFYILRVYQTELISDGSLDTLTEAEKSCLYPYGYTIVERDTIPVPEQDSLIG